MTPPILYRNRRAYSASVGANPVDPWRFVGAHYFSVFPLDIANTVRPDWYDTQFIAPDGEGGKHLAYGGFIRDRPTPVGPRPKSGTTDQIKIEDAEIECNYARDAGIDAWWFDCLSLNPASSRYTQLQWMTQACVNTGFPMVPMIDCKTNTPENLTSAMAISSLTPIYQSGAVKTVLGRPLLSSFNGEAFNLAWWTAVLDGLESNLGVRPRLILGFLNASDSNMNTYAGIVDGFGVWGPANPANVPNGTRGAYAKSLGKKWCAPIRPSEYRPKAKAYAESKNRTLYRLMWDKARSEDADMIQIVTWNDYSECTQINPSEKSGDATLKVLPYQMDWWRNKAQPAVTVDRLLITNRRHFTTATATVEPAPRPTAILDGNSTPQDTIEVEVYATAPATVSINGGAAQAVQAGLTALTAPLAVGTPTATMTRNSSVVASVTSNVPVVSSPEVYDFTYYAASSS